MSFGAVLGGALQGIGAGIVKTGEDKAASQAADVLARRQMALAQYQSDLRVGENEQKGQIDRTNTSSQYDLMDRNAARSTARDTTKAIVVGKADTTNKLSVVQVEHANRLAVDKVQHKYKLTEQQASLAQQHASDLASAGVEVGETRVGTDGAMVFFNKKGQPVSQTKPGMFTPDGAKPDASEGGAIARARAGRESAEPDAAKPQKAANGGKTYTLKELKETAETRGISVAEVRKVMQDNGYKLAVN